MEPTPPLAEPPRRLFRLGRLPNLLAPTNGPPDAAFHGAAVVLCSTRRGAFIEALAAVGAAGGPLALPGDAAVAALRFADPRPVLDLRAPVARAALPPAIAASLGDPGEEEWSPQRLAEASALAIEAGFAGVAYRSPAAPSQVCWAIRPDAALTLLDAPRPVSPHDPDLAAVRRLLSHKT